MLPGDRLICVFVHPGPKDRFSPWPLHITIVPWFRNDVPTDELCREIKDALGGEVQPFEVMMDGEATFGRRKKVNLIAAPSPLFNLEKTVRKVLKKHGSWIVDETTKRKRSFRPHVTAQAGERLHEGDRFICSQLSVVTQHGGYKTVEGEVCFG